MGENVRSLALFVVAGLTEIGGCWLVWQTLCTAPTTSCWSHFNSMIKCACDASDWGLSAAGDARLIVCNQLVGCYGFGRGRIWRCIAAIACSNQPGWRQGGCADTDHCPTLGQCLARLVWSHRDQVASCALFHRHRYSVQHCRRHVVCRSAETSYHGLQLIFFAS